MRDIDTQPLEVPWMADLIEINVPSELEQYRLAWNMLLPQTPRASLFHTLDWLQTYWKYFGEDQQLRVFIIRSGGKPIGIVPLCVRTDRYHVGNVRVLTYPLSDWGTWYGPIGPNPAACLFMAMRHLQNTPRDWDILDLRWTDSPSETNDPTKRAMAAADLPAERSDYQETSIVQMEGTDWETYHSGLSKKWRHELGRQQRGLERDFDVQFERHRPLGVSHGECDPRWDLYDNCLSIAEKSWQGESTTGNTLSHASVKNFLQASHEIAAKLGMLDMVVLKLNGQPAAFQYNYCYDGNLFGLRMGYDQNITRQGAGKALLGWTIKDSFERGDRKLDMGIGDYVFKRSFRTGTETSQRFTHYPWQAWRGQSVRFSHWIKSHWLSEEKTTVKQ